MGIPQTPFIAIAPEYPLGNILVPLDHPMKESWSAPGQDMGIPRALADTFLWHPQADQDTPGTEE